MSAEKFYVESRDVVARLKDDGRKENSSTNNYAESQGFPKNSLKAEVLSCEKHKNADFHVQYRQINQALLSAFNIQNEISPRAGSFLRGHTYNSAL